MLTLLHSLATFLSAFGTVVIVDLLLTRSGLKEECFAMGRLSALLGKELNTFTRETFPWVSGPPRQATLLLFDRARHITTHRSHPA